ncbi:MAG TPA: ATP-binding cassette domain-containing protein [Trebonia sp.]|nr:ATP-binding cassette domain-containing protein [Trebonia sp.]
MPNEAVALARNAPDDVLVAAQGLRRVYASGLTAVDGIDFTLRRGEAFGFLGPNGAGKSSTMRMLSCIAPIDGGSLQLFGLDAARHGSAIRARIGVVPQADSLDEELTVRENLLLFGRYFGLRRALIRERATYLLDFAQLKDKADDRVEALSGGMRRRLTIARALINEPDLLLLDEPTTGLDPQARHLLWERLYQLKSEGVTLVLTTHYMDEAEQLCDRLVVMDHGRIVAEGSPRELIDAHVTREVLELRFALGQQQAMAEKAAMSGARVEALPDRVLIYADDGEDALSRLHAIGLAPIASLVRRSSLEDVFLKLTGRTLTD